MATSPGVFKATALKAMSKFPVLPPIEGSQQREEVGQTAAANEIVKKITVQKKVLRHRRSKVQRDQLHKILYVSVQLWKVNASMTATTIEELSHYLL